jgi:hypothetical protein
MTERTDGRGATLPVPDGRTGRGTGVAPVDVDG